MKTLHRKRREKMKFTRMVPVSEVFYSIEGEGILTGFPTVFVRTFGCNFTCSGFSNPNGGETVLVPIQKLEEFAPYPSGCDSIYSWSPAYKEFTNKHTVIELVEKIRSVLPQPIPNEESNTGTEWKIGRSKPILSLTGGEPTLHQKFWIQFLQHSFMSHVDKLLIETNGAVPLGKEFLNALKSWSDETKGLVIWANSPKLSRSGESRECAINVDVIRQQHSVSDVQYFKFVTDGSDSDIAEIEQALADYETAVGTIKEAQVLLMPVGGTYEQQQQMQRQVAESCLRHGYIYCSRVHVTIWGNCVGT